MRMYGSDAGPDDKNNNCGDNNNYNNNVNSDPRYRGWLAATAVATTIDLYRYFHLRQLTSPVLLFRSQ